MLVVNSRSHSLIKSAVGEDGVRSQDLSWSFASHIASLYLSKGVSECCGDGARSKDVLPPGLLFTWGQEQHQRQYSGIYRSDCHLKNPFTQSRHSSLKNSSTSATLIIISRGR